ncbi:glycerophosphodiester phosphodiesterase [Ideonella sp. BN130291]|uniref:glycerophosphodiester phosphodiesterase n=1 Tax=Ideonella sp. BN130291 TaxID=3112940 RepID=UPI002E2545C0|nr:glycerophosphodiester phosphodiesterase [Ideonella sp. BN130291]
MQPWPYPFWVAHRGAGKLAPENTLAAFRVGAAHGYRAFECDVKLSADGALFLLHDAGLQRTTSGSGTAGQQPWSDLSRLDAGGWHSRAYAGEPLASLDAIAAYVLRNGYALNIEIKPTPGEEARTGDAVARYVAQCWPADTLPPLLSSFQPAALAAAQTAAPQCPRALLLDTLQEGWLTLARSLECVAIVAAYPLLDRAVIQQAHDAGLRVLAYTVNDPAEAHRLRDAGIDGLITDEVARFSPDPAAIRD